MFTNSHVGSTKTSTTTTALQTPARSAPVALPRKTLPPRKSRATKAGLGPSLAARRAPPRPVVHAFTILHLHCLATASGFCCATFFAARSTFAYTPDCDRALARSGTSLSLFCQNLLVHDTGLVHESSCTYFPTNIVSTLRHIRAIPLVLVYLFLIDKVPFLLFQRIWQVSGNVLMKRV
jgi:hypothetical protein